MSKGNLISADLQLAVTSAQDDCLENLMGNAWKYTSKEPSRKIEFGSSSINGENIYFVRDNGIGFDTAYTPKIFIPFERLH